MDLLEPTAVRDLSARQLACVEATVVALTYPAPQASPQVVAHLRDATGTLLVTWMGRTQVPGVNVGDDIRVQAVVAMRQGRATMLNPRYRLVRTAQSKGNDNA